MARIPFALMLLLAGCAVATSWTSAALLSSYRHRETEWKELVEKQSATIKMQSDTIRKQSDALTKLMASSDKLIAAIRVR